MSRANEVQDFLPNDLQFDAERPGQGHILLVGALQETLVAARAFDHTLACQHFRAALHALQVITEFRKWSAESSLTVFQSPRWCLLNHASFALEGIGVLFAKTLRLLPSPHL